MAAFQHIKKYWHCESLRAHPLLGRLFLKRNTWNRRYSCFFGSQSIFGMNKIVGHSVLGLVRRKMTAEHLPLTILCEPNKANRHIENHNEIRPCTNNVYATFLCFFMSVFSVFIRKIRVDVPAAIFFRYSGLHSFGKVWLMEIGRIHFLGANVITSLFKFCYPCTRTRITIIVPKECALINHT